MAMPRPVLRRTLMGTGFVTLEISKRIWLLKLLTKSKLPNTCIRVLKSLVIGRVATVTGFVGVEMSHTFRAVAEQTYRSFPRTTPRIAGSAKLTNLGFTGSEMS